MIAKGPPAYPSVDLPSTDEFVPFGDPQPIVVDRRGPISLGSITIVSGETAVSCWGSADTIAEAETGVKLQLAPDRPVVIGRQDEGIPPYLDPAYRSTRIVPGTGQSVVRSASEGIDIRVSRAHFMLRGAAGGILLTNGVPQRGGGIRPPTNSTWMHAPISRLMDPGEEFLIEHGGEAVLQLPNNTVVRICAE